MTAPPTARPERATRRLALPLAAPLTALALLAGCATSGVDAQWTAADHTLPPLAGLKVLVSCEAYEPVVRQLCEDQLASEVSARGATPARSPDLEPTTPGRPIPVAQYLQAARAAGAAAVFAASVEVGVRDVGSSSGVSIGIGGFGIGRGGFGGGVGISAPIGGNQEINGYVAQGRLTDSANGRLVWSAKASAAPSRDIAGQMGELARALVGSADRSGMF